MSSLISVTAALSAKNPPVSTTPLLTVTDAKAMTIPLKRLVSPIVAELPTKKNTLHGRAPLVRMILAADAVVKVEPILKTNWAFWLPRPLSVRVPVSWAEDE